MLASFDRRAQDPDATLLRDLNAPPPLHEAREALSYWDARHRSLPRRRLAARREARAMALRWEARVREAELAAWGSGPMAMLRRWVLRPRPTLARRVDRALTVVLVLAVAATLVGAAALLAAAAALQALLGG